MNHAAFQADVFHAQKRLAAEERRGFWLGLLTLGLFDNRRRIAAAKEYLEKCRIDLDRYNSLTMEAEALDELLRETIELEGVRVSKYIFTDLPALATLDYGAGWEQLRDLILTRDHYECQESDGYCDGPLQIHHLVPLTKGGTNDLDNLLTLCFFHHSMKHDHLRGRYNGSVWRGR